jgi:transcriptional regulator with XRE-family HTH domain
MSTLISAKQIKAGRALLDWVQDDLAGATGLSVTTIRNLESGDMSPRGSTMHVIRVAMESSGIEFTDGEGVRRRSDEIRIYQGLDSCDAFFEDMLQTVQGKVTDISVIFKSREAFTESCNIKNGKLGRLETLSNHAVIKCLLTEAIEPPVTSPKFQLRIIMKQLICPFSFFVYGSKYAIVLMEPSGSFRFIVFNAMGAAQDHRNYFYALWDMAEPQHKDIQVQNKRMRA